MDKVYFSRITQDHWVSKNNLQKAAHKLAKEMDRRIITADKVMDFKVEFIDGIKRLNDEYHRCKPVHLSIEKSQMENGDIVFWADGIFCLILFLAKDV